MNKKILCLIIMTIIHSSMLHSNASEKYLLQYKPNENLKYNEFFSPTPQIMGSFQASIIEKTSKNSTTNISIREQDNGNLVIYYNNKLNNGKSCCNPFTYFSYIYKLESFKENIIKPSGNFINNKKADINVGCFLGFNIFRMNLIDDKSKQIYYIFLCYFPENEVQINSVWKNAFEFSDEDKNNKIDIVYTLENVKNNIAHITGNISNKLFIESDFDIEKGHWIYFKTYYFENEIKKYYTTLELI